MILSYIAAASLVRSATDQHEHELKLELNAVAGALLRRV
jgi:hypothetical protein